jgi:hypothetical protein
MASFFFGRSSDHRAESHSTLGFGYSPDQLRILLRAEVAAAGPTGPVVRSGRYARGSLCAFARGRAFAKRGGIVY